MPQLNPDFYPSQIFWLIISIAILYLSLRYFLIPRIESSIREREKLIEANLVEADKLLQRAQDLTAASNKLLDDSRQEATKITQNAIANKNHLVDQAMKELRHEIDNELEKNRHDMVNFQKNELKHIVEKSAINIVAKAGNTLKIELQDSKT